MNINYEKMLVDLNTEINKFKEESVKRNDRFAESMGSAAEVVHTKSEFYKYRYDYVTARFKAQGTIAEIQEHRKSVVRTLLISQKTKQALDPDFEDFKFEPRNGDERKIFEENYMRSLDRVVEVLNNYVSMINEAILGIDKMIYGIPYVLELEKYKNHFAQ